MSVLARALPVPSGKAQALEDHIAEAREHEDFEKTLKGFGIEHESWHVQETPAGELVFQYDDPPAMLQAFSQSKGTLPVMQNQFIKETLGVDLSQSLPGPRPKTIFEWP